MLGIYIIGLTAALHVVWGIALLMNDPRLHLAVPLYGYFAVLGQSSDALLAVALIFSGFLAMGSQFFFRENSTSLAFLMPQQVLVLIPGITSFFIIYTGNLPSGNVRTTEFIMVNQAPLLLLAICHTSYIVNLTARTMNSMYNKRKLASILRSRT